MHLYDFSCSNTAILTEHLDSGLHRNDTNITVCVFRVFRGVLFFSLRLCGEIFFAYR